MSGSWKDILKETVTRTDSMTEAEIMESVSTQKEKNFNWHGYLKGLGIVLLTVSIIAASVLLIMIKTQGIVAAIGILFGGIVFHGLFCWCAEVLKRLTR